MLNPATSDIRIFRGLVGAVRDTVAAPLLRLAGAHEQLAKAFAAGAGRLAPIFMPQQITAITSAYSEPPDGKPSSPEIAPTPVSAPRTQPPKPKGFTL